MPAKPKHDEALLAACRQSFRVYCLIVHDTDMPWIADGKATLAEHHKVIANALGAGINIDEKPHYDKDWANKLRIIYVTATAAQSYKISNAVKNTIEFNGYYQAVFPRVKKDPNKWSEPEWKVGGNTIKDSTFLALGRNGPMLGSRGDLIILDDIVDEEVRRSPTEQVAVIDWLNNVVMKVPVPHPDRVNVEIEAPRGGAKTTLVQWWLEWVIGRASIGYQIPRGMRMVCTRWYGGDPADWAKERGWQSLSMKALTEVDGEEVSFWPDRFTVEELRQERRAAPLSFQLQMQNEIVPLEGDLWSKADFRNRFDYVPEPDRIKWVVTSYDTNATITGRSYTAGIVVLITHEWRYYVLHLLRDRFAYPDLRTAVRDVDARFKPHFNFIENKSSGIQLVQELTQEYVDGKIHGRIVPLAPAGQKGGPPNREEIEWVQTVTMPYADGRVWLPSGEFFRRMHTEDWTETFINEHIQYPSGTTNDAVIAMSQLIYVFETSKHDLLAREKRLKEPPLRYGRRPPVPPRRLAI